MRSLLIFALVSCLVAASGARGDDPGLSWLDLDNDEVGSDVDLLGLRRLETLGEPTLEELGAEELGVTQLSGQTRASQGILAAEDIVAGEAEMISSESAIRPAPVQHSFATIDPRATGLVRSIPVYESHSHSSRLVRYDVPLNDHVTHQQFMVRGIRGRLVQVPGQNTDPDSASDRIKRFLNPLSEREKQQTIRMVRYEVPAEDIAFHSQMVELDGQILSPGMLRLPEVRFFQPKARIFTDLKRDNDEQFDLFADGAILASLDVVELYFPMPLISERFAEAFGKSSRLSALGWRVGGTVGLGITTAINNGLSDNGSAPVSTLSGGIRYEFPLGRPSQEVLETGDSRLDERTRVGIEFGFQGGFSTRESLRDRTDVGMYFGILVNTPWGG